VSVVLIRGLLVGGFGHPGWWSQIFEMRKIIDVSTDFKLLSQTKGNAIYVIF